MRFRMLGMLVVGGLALARLVKDAGIEPVRLPPRSPNLNAYAERCVRSGKDEWVNTVILFGGRSLRRAMKQYDAHCHSERNHQARDNRVTIRLGGLLRYHYRAAA